MVEDAVGKRGKNMLRMLFSQNRIIVLIPAGGWRGRYREKKESMTEGAAWPTSEGRHP